MIKKGILAVSFGTSYADTREKTIGAIERAISAALPDYRLYRAFTSVMIKAKMDKMGTPVFNVEQALNAMKNDSIEEVLIQPTHVINGTEYDMLVADVDAHSAGFKSVKCGNPLLTSTDDYKELASIIAKEYSSDNDEAVVLMGHGSEHYSNSAYPAFEYVLKAMECSNIFLGTVEGYPTIEEVKSQLKNGKFKRVKLVPMMIVAGDHANNDMAVDWKNEIEELGYEVSCVMRGLGELEGVQQMFVKHIKELI